MSVCAIYGSARNGNSEMLAELVLENINVTDIYLRDKHIEPVKDLRDTDIRIEMPEDDFEEVISTMLKHDILLFVTPLYWYGMSGIMKNFIDRWFQVLRDERYHFRETMSQKKAYVIVVGSGAKMRGLPLVQQFQLIFDYFSTTFSGYILGNANHPKEILQDQQAILAAELLNKELRLLLGK